MKSKDINLNDVALDVIAIEGQKVNLSIAQVKEILKIVFTRFTLEQIVKMYFKYN